MSSKFLAKLITLQLEYVLARYPRSKSMSDSIGQCLNDLTQVPELLALSIGTDGDRDGGLLWEELAADLKDRYKESGTPLTAADLWEVVRPVVLQSLPAYESAEQLKLENALAGFTYEYAPVYFSDSKHPYLTLHFRNAFVPDSPFLHMSDLRNALLEIVQVTRQTRADITQVQCASWLNETRNFPVLFPPEWLTGSYRVPVAGNLGWWGQFIDRTGQFNEELAARFRRTWDFPFHNRHCRCSIMALHDHLMLT